jgi:hypothetical protein
MVQHDILPVIHVGTHLQVPCQMRNEREVDVWLEVGDRHRQRAQSGEDHHAWVYRRARTVSAVSSSRDDHACRTFRDRGMLEA